MIKFMHKNQSTIKRFYRKITKLFAKIYLHFHWKKWESMHLGMYISFERHSHIIEKKTHIYENNFTAQMAFGLRTESVCMILRNSFQSIQAVIRL